MGNIFMKETHDKFKWENLGNIKLGRAELGEEMPVLFYRLFQYTLNDVLIHELGKETADSLFRKSGYLAGSEFVKNVMDVDVDTDVFFSELQRQLKENKIGILRIESFEEETGKIVLSVAEDLDCSGLPHTSELVCTYDEGFIAGIMDTYTNNKYSVKEVDCWASGDRVCRFEGVVVDG